MSIVPTHWYLKISSPHHNALIPCVPVSKVSYKVTLFPTYVINLIPGYILASDLSLGTVPREMFIMS